MNLPRYCLSLVWFLLAGSVFIPSVTWSYDAQTLQSIGYDEVSFSTFSYNPGATLHVNEEASGLIGTGDVFTQFGEFLAAEGVGAAAATESRLVIGRGADLAKPGALNQENSSLAAWLAIKAA
jgi:hypothetical protein